VTVPIYYESRLARIELDEDEKPALDDEVAGLTDAEAHGEQEKLKSKWANVEAVGGDERRLAMGFRDLVEHFENRVVGMDGKTIVVCMSRRIRVALYDHIIRLHPEWHSNDDEIGVLKIAMIGAASDPKEWKQHIGGKARLELLAKRASDPEYPLKLVLVRAIWLTGFDELSVHTMHIDKPMRGQPAAASSWCLQARLASQPPPGPPICWEKTSQLADHFGRDTPHSCGSCLKIQRD
jgi:type I restriction enzyme R subunit